MTLVQSEPKKLYIRVDAGAYIRYTPTSTTLLYLPLNTTYQATDQSNRHIVVWNAWAQFGIYQWADCAYFDGNDKLVLSDIGSWTSFTRCFWFYYTPTSNYMAIFWSNSTSLRYYGISLTSSILGRKVQSSYMVWSNSETGITTSAYTTGWHMYTIVKDGTNVKVYVDGTWDSTASNGYSSWILTSWSDVYCIWKNLYTSSWSTPFIWYLSEFIIDNKARTDAEVATQYNNMLWYFSS